MSKVVVVAVGLGIGFTSGLRAFTPIALVSWLAIWGWMPLAGSRLWFIGTQAFAIVMSIFAVLELIGDKLPKTPARIQVMPLAVRVVTGGLSSAAVCFSAGWPWFCGLLLGPVGAVAGAFSGYYVRRSIVRRLRIPDIVPALTEDFITIAGTLFLVHNFFHTAV